MPASPAGSLFARRRRRFADSLLPPAALRQHPAARSARRRRQARALMETMRCLVCQGQSIADSDAEMAGDMRALVRERIQAGESPKQIRDWLIARYGNWVSLRAAARAADLAALGGAGPAGRRSASCSPAAASAAEADADGLGHRSSCWRWPSSPRSVVRSCARTRARCNSSRAALLLALAGYAWQGRPGIAGQPEGAAGAPARCPRASSRRCARTCSAASTAPTAG